MRQQPKITTATTTFKETKTKTPNSIYSKCGRLQQALQMPERIWHVTESHRPYANMLVTHRTPQCCSAPSRSQEFLYVDLAGPMWKKQSIKPPPVAHSRHFEKQWGFSRQSLLLYCAPQRFCFSLQSWYCSPLAPLQNHCLSCTGKTRK